MMVILLYSLLWSNREKVSYFSYPFLELQSPVSDAGVRNPLSRRLYWAVPSRGARPALLAALCKAVRGLKVRLRLGILWSLQFVPKS